MPKLTALHQTTIFFAIWSIIASFLPLIIQSYFIHNIISSILIGLTTISSLIALHSVAHTQNPYALIPLLFISILNVSNGITTVVFLLAKSEEWRAGKIIIIILIVLWVTALPFFFGFTVVLFKKMKIRRRGIKKMKRLNKEMWKKMWKRKKEESMAEETVENPVEECKSKAHDNYDTLEFYNV